MTPPTARRLIGGKVLDCVLHKFTVLILIEVSLYDLLSSLNSKIRHFVAQLLKSGLLLALDFGLRLLLQPEHEAQARRHFEAAKMALEHLDGWVGAYPYPTLTLVDALGGANGMEYPTLVTCGTLYGLPEWIRFPEMIIVHEIGHQYFYGVLASNEAEEPWLDEGITSYVEARILEQVYGPGSLVDLPGLRVGEFGREHTEYAAGTPTRGAIYGKSWRYPSMAAYGRAAYAKPATVLRTLEGYLGWEVMREVLQTYYARFAFRHPTTRDFIAVTEEVSGRDLGWFFEQYVYGTAAVDYAIESLSARRRPDGAYRSAANERFLAGIGKRAWDGHAGRTSFSFDHAAPVVEAAVDPERRVWMDLDHLNNRRVLDEDDVLARKYGLKATVLFQLLYYLVAGLL